MSVGFIAIRQMVFTFFSNPHDDDLYAGHKKWQRDLQIVNHRYHVAPDSQ